MRKGTIYVLKDPIDLSIKYIGQTKLSLISKLSQHIHAIKSKSFPVNLWVKSCVDMGYLPLIQSIELCDISELDIREQYHISTFISQGISLLNVHLGGQKKRFIPREVMEKGSAGWFKSGVKESPERKEKRAAAIRKAWKENPMLAEANRKRNVNRILLDVTKEDLYRLYITENKTQLEICNIYNCKLNVIERRCRQYGIVKKEKGNWSNSSILLHPETGVFYYSVKEVAEIIGMNTQSASQLIKGERKYKKNNTGFIFV